MGRTDRQAFVDAYGTGPYECFFCREACEFEHVHHIDGNRQNEHPLNLAAAHAHCHHRHHTLLRRVAGWGYRGGRPKGSKNSAQANTNISAGLKGNTNGHGNKGRKFSMEHRAKIAQAMKGNKNRKSD